MAHVNPPDGSGATYGVVDFVQAVARHGVDVADTRRQMVSTSWSATFFPIISAFSTVCIVAEASKINTKASEKKFRPQRTGRCGRNGVRKKWIVLFDLHQNGVGSHGLPLTDQNLLDRTGEIARDGVLHLHRFENGDLLSGLHRVADLHFEFDDAAGSGAVTTLP